jgi:dCTP deaminase
MPDELRLADLSQETPGVLPSQLLAEAIGAGWVAGEPGVPSSNVQPASLDLRLGDHAYALRCSFLARDQPVERKLEDFVVDKLDLAGEGAVLATNRPYLVQLVESLCLPPFLRAKANPKSSTGRIDVFTRVITDRSHRFDEIAPGYCGPLYVEIVPLSFSVRVRAGLALNQMRLIVGRSPVTDGQLRELQNTDPVLFVDGRPADDRQFSTADGLFLTLDLKGDQGGWIGYRAKRNTPLLDIGTTGVHRSENFWERVRTEKGSRLLLEPEMFYLLLSEEAVRVPPSLACEMTAYDPTSGELRTHYAGFFDPGFGYDRSGKLRGSRAALEVRAHDVPFMIEHGQRVCKLTFERMVCPPVKLYGEAIGSNYQGQVDTLGKHFRR